MSFSVGKSGTNSLGCPGAPCGVKFERGWPVVGGWGLLPRAWGGERAGCGPGTGCAERGVAGRSGVAVR
jgi:hypothetical protein